MADLLKFSIPGKPQYVSVVRMAVSSAANAAGLSVEDIEDIKIAVSEVCTHIFCGNNDKTYEVSCLIDDESMTISIDDVEEEADVESDQMRECFCLPVSEYLLPAEEFDPSACMIMLRALMDQVNIFSWRNQDVLIKMIKNFSRE